MFYRSTAVRQVAMFYRSTAMREVAMFYRSTAVRKVAMFYISTAIGYRIITEDKFVPVEAMKPYGETVT